MEKQAFLDRQKIIDMMLTMHSITLDRKKSYSRILDLFLIMMSSILVLLSLIDPQILRLFGKSESEIRLYLGILSCIVFILSMVSMLVNWKGDVGQHAKACETLANLKSTCRSILIRFDEIDEPHRINNFERVNEILASLPKIPDSRFHKYKKKHKLKIELSKLIDNYPGSSLLLLKLVLWYSHNKKFIKIRSSL